MVWYGGRFELHTCPVRELDEDAQFYIRWMTATHRQTEQGWMMTHLPGPGGLGEQDAVLMDGISCARDEADAFQREQDEARSRERHYAEYAARIEQESRG